MSAPGSRGSISVSATLFDIVSRKAVLDDVSMASIVEALIVDALAMSSAELAAFVERCREGGERARGRQVEPPVVLRLPVRLPYGPPKPTPAWQKRHTIKFDVSVRIRGLVDEVVRRDNIKHRAAFDVAINAALDAAEAARSEAA